MPSNKTIASDGGAAPGFPDHGDGVLPLQLAAQDLPAGNPLLRRGEGAVPLRQPRLVEGASDAELTRGLPHNVTSYSNYFNPFYLMPGSKYSVTFGAQVEGVSQGRLPDGSANILSFPGTASPGASNWSVNSNSSAGSSLV